MSPEYDQDDDPQYGVPTRRDKTEKPVRRKSRPTARPSRRSTNKPTIAGKHQRRNKHFSW
jgi:hypothetical protein